MRSARRARRANRCRSRPRQRPKTSSEHSMPSLIEIRVKATRGSAPREAGTRMWVSAEGTRGTIGGGNLEYSAIKIAREMLLARETQKERKFTPGDALRQCFGGSGTPFCSPVRKIAVA